MWVVRPMAALFSGFMSARMLPEDRFDRNAYRTRQSALRGFPLQVRTLPAAQHLRLSFVGLLRASSIDSRELGSELLPALDAIAIERACFDGGADRAPGLRV